jgi:HK97 family phage major capsid protein
MNTQERYNGLLTEMDALRAKETLTPEEGAAFKSKLIEATTLKGQIEDMQALDALKTWRDSSAGSAVKSGFSGEALPGEGDIEGVTADSSGYLYDVAGVGNAKLKALKSGAYKSAFVDYLRARPGKTLPDKSMKVLMEGLDSAGGFWVPPDMRPELIKRMAGVTGVVSDVNKFTIGSDIVSFPTVSYVASNQYTSGVRFSWTAEAPASDISEATNPVAGRVNIPVHTATCAVIMTRALLEDSQFDILGYVTGLIGEAFALGEDDAYINGTGVGQPQGILTATNATVAHIFATGLGGMYVPSGISAAVSWAGTAIGTPESGEGFIGMEHAMPPQYDAGVKWYAHKTAYAQARAIVDTTGRPFWANSYPDYTNGYQSTILGKPVVMDNFVPVPAADSYSVILGDLKAYYAPQRVGISIEVLRELRALKDEVIIYARRRFGGQLVKDFQVKVMKLGTS